MLANFFKALNFSTLSLHAVLPERAAAFSRILAAHQAGQLSPDIDRIIGLDEIQDARRRIEASENLGKMVRERLAADPGLRFATGPAVVRTSPQGGGAFRPATDPRRPFRERFRC